MRITIYEIVHIRLYIHTREPLAEGVGCMLTVVVCYHHRADKEATVAKLFTQAQHILIVSDAEVGTHLVLLNVFSADYYHNFYLVADLLKHTQLGIGLEAGQHTTGMMVVKQLAA